MKQDPIVIVGGGFGGVFVAKRLLKQGLRVLLISKTDHFTFTPLLHEVATGSLIAQDVVFSYDSFFPSSTFEFLRGDVSQIDPVQKKVIVDGIEVSYSDLVLATGSVTNEKLIKGTSFAYTLKSAEDALRLKQAIIHKAQGAQKEVSISVIGGGPTGCELVFEIERLLCTLKKRYKTFKAHLTLIQSGQDVGGRVHPSVLQHIKALLKKRKIEVVYDAFALEITKTHVQTTVGSIESDIVILAAGVRANTDFLRNILPLDPQGNICVQHSLAVEGVEHIHALGDVIAMKGVVIPKLAQTAIQEAKIVAENIMRSRTNKPLKSYEPKIKGFLLSLGYGQGAGEVFGVVVKGLPAWYLWRTVYLLKTPGMLNKLRVAFSWTLGLFQGRNLTSL